MACGVQLDMSMDVMEEMRFRKKNSELMKKLAKETHFTFEEVEALLLIYYNIQKNNTESKQSTGISPNQLSDVLHNSMDMTDAELTNRLFTTLIKGSNFQITMDIWVKCLSLLLRGTLEEKITHCFAIYDTMGQGKIKRDTMLSFLDSFIVGSEDSEDEVKDIAETLLIKMDLDRDGSISFDDYRKCCLAQPLLLEALGPCFPSRLAVHAFLSTFTPNTGKI